MINLIFLLGQYACEKCGRFYKYKRSLKTHIKFECGKTPQFQCQHCPFKTYQKGNLKIHVGRKHILKT